MSSENGPNTAVLQVQNVGKSYRRYAHPTDWLKEHLFKRRLAEEQWALRNVSLDLPRGSSMGLVGKNGAGKSTLLQLIAGTLSPTEGQVIRRGRIAALLELGAGFNPDFTGLENATLNAALMGLSPQEIAEKLPEIIEFSGIGEAIHRPVRTYSSGMFVRLAFSVATATDPDILIIDEALSVGDGAFARKSFDRIMAIQERGASLLFCSHSLYQVERLCERALWINNGQLMFDGPAKEAILAYQESLDREALSDQTLPQVARRNNDQPLATGSARIASVRIFNNGTLEKNEVIECETGKTTLVFEIAIDFSSDIPLPRVAISLHTLSGIMVFGTGNLDQPEKLKTLRPGHAEITFTLPALPLLPGHYRMDLGVFCENGIHFYEVISPVVRLHLSHKAPTQGLCILPHQWS